MSNRPLSLWYPVWNQLHQSDPFMASIRNIVRASHEPTVETALIGSVFYMAQTENGIEYAEAIARRMAGKGWRHDCLCPVYQGGAYPVDRGFEGIKDSCRCRGAEGVDESLSETSG